MKKWQVGMMMLSVGALGCEASGSADSLATMDQGISGGQVETGLPFVGLIYNQNSGGYHCTGTLISPRVVLTAGHCTYRSTAKKMWFVIGPSLDLAQQKIAVDRVVPHPQFNYAKQLNDIAYLVLTEDAAVAPISSGEPMDQTWVGRPLVFSGYGFSNPAKKSGAFTKRTTDLTTESVSPTVFRVTDPTASGKMICGGDSGGPALYVDAADQHRVAGVVSYGDQKTFAIITRVDAFLDFASEALPPPAVTIPGPQVVPDLPDTQTSVPAPSPPAPDAGK